MFEPKLIDDDALFLDRLVDIESKLCSYLFQKVGGKMAPAGRFQNAYA